MEHISHEESAKDETFEMAPTLPGPPQPAKENSPEVQMEVQIPSLPESQQFLSDDEDDRPEENSENNMLAALNGDFDAQMIMQENIEFTNDNFTENVGSDAMDVSNNIVPENPGLILESEMSVEGNMGDLVAPLPSDYIQEASEMIIENTVESSVIDNLATHDNVIANDMIAESEPVPVPDVSGFLPVDPVSVPDISASLPVGPVAVPDVDASIQVSDPVSLPDMTVSFPEDIDSGALAEVMESGALPEVINSGVLPEAIDSGIGNILGSGALPEAIDSGALPEAIDSGALPEAIDSAGLPEVIESGALPQIIDSEALPDIVDSAVIPEVIDSGTLPDILSAVGEPAALQEQMVVDEPMAMVMDDVQQQMAPIEPPIPPQEDQAKPIRDILHRLYGKGREEPPPSYNDPAYYDWEDPNRTPSPPPQRGRKNHSRNAFPAFNAFYPPTPYNAWRHGIAPQIHKRRKNYKPKKSQKVDPSLPHRKSKYRGVYWERRDQKWRARAYCLGKRYSAGSYTVEREAALAVNRLCRKLGVPLQNPELEAIVLDDYEAPPIKPYRPRKKRSNIFEGKYPPAIKREQFSVKHEYIDPLDELDNF